MPSFKYFAQANRGPSFTKYGDIHLNIEKNVFNTDLLYSLPTPICFTFKAQKL